MWLAMTYLGSNVVLNSLNFYWFGKMIETVRKRFDKKGPSDAKTGKETMVDAAEVKSAARRESIVLDVADRLDWEEKTRAAVDGTAEGQSTGLSAGGDVSRRK